MKIFSGVIVIIILIFSVLIVEMITTNINKENPSSEVLYPVSKEYLGENKEFWINEASGFYQLSVPVHLESVILQSHFS